MQDCADASGVGSAMPSEEHGIMPKQETQAWDFIKSNPKFDGRTVCVAIFDSGVDPGAPGLQVRDDRCPFLLFSRHENGHLITRGPKNDLERAQCLFPRI